MKYYIKHHLILRYLKVIYRVFEVVVYKLKSQNTTNMENVSDYLCVVEFDNVFNA